MLFFRRREPASRRSLPALLATGLTLAFAGAAWAASGPGGSGPSESLFIAQVLVLIVVGRLLGEAMQRIGQPAVMGQLIAGIILGPSVFGALLPDWQHALFPASREQKAMIDAVSQLGIMLLLLLTGMETDLGLVRKVRRAAFSVSVAGVAVPFACGFALGEFLPDAMLPRPELRLITSLFLGTALSISSVKIVAMVVREMNFLRRNIGQVIVASAIIDDTIGWIIIALTFGIALHGSFEFASLAKSVVGTLVFLAVSLTIGRRLVFMAIRWANDNFVSDMPVISVILVITGVMALITNAIGVHTVLGAFVAGVLVGQSPILTRHIEEELRGLIVALFMPVFFGLAGLGADLTILANPNIALLTAGLVLIASVGKFGGAFVGGWFGGLGRAESIALGCGMNARGSTEVIVASIGLSMGALSQDLFTMIVAMAVLTTMAMPPMLRWALRRLPLTPEEAERIDRETFEAQGFIPRLERLLVGADESASGRLASRVAGLLAGARGLPVTILRLGEGRASGPVPSEAALANDVGAEAVVRKAAAVASDDPDRDPVLLDVDVTMRDADTVGQAGEIVAAEAAKGYDLLIAGLEPTLRSKGGLDARVSDVALSFSGPLALVSARGSHVDEPLRGDLNILVAVTGTEVSRRGAEVALALARAHRSQLTALFVPGAHNTKARRRRFRALRGQNEAILKDIVELGDKFGVPVRTAVRVNMSAEAAILRQARIGGHSLIVLGVSKRPGDVVSFGHVAGALLEDSDRSLVLVASGAAAS
ncbi:Na+/H+ antiporter [Alsobacter metallidurans]|uniref:Na+/H+ antiporter n=1 Tax=Alsobacter metallidurans TaxID=340221 RepID=A0A917MGD2_9HYPH|nr:Na+/H+ antiporter [Alsobacter metallidurans]